MPRNRELIFALLLISIFIIFSSLGCSLLQKPISDNRGVAFFLQEVEAAAREGRWAQASSGVDRLETAWQRDRDRLNSPRTKLNVTRFDRALKELKRDVKARNERETLEQVKYMEDVYRNITSP